MPSGAIWGTIRKLLARRYSAEQKKRLLCILIQLREDVVGDGRQDVLAGGCAMKKSEYVGCGFCRTRGDKGRRSRHDGLHFCSLLSTGVEAAHNGLLHTSVTFRATKLCLEVRNLSMLGTTRTAALATYTLRWCCSKVPHFYCKLLIRSAFVKRALWRSSH